MKLKVFLSVIALLMICAIGMALGPPGVVASSSNAISDQFMPAAIGNSYENSIAQGAGIVDIITDANNAFASADQSTNTMDIPINMDISTGAEITLASAAGTVSPISFMMVNTTLETPNIRANDATTYGNSISVSPMATMAIVEIPAGFSSGQSCLVSLYFYKMDNITQVGNFTRADITLTGKNSEAMTQAIQPGAILKYPISSGAGSGISAFLVSSCFPNPWDMNSFVSTSTAMTAKSLSHPVLFSFKSKGLLAA